MFVSHINFLLMSNFNISHIISWVPFVLYMISTTNIIPNKNTMQQDIVIIDYLVNCLHKQSLCNVPHVYLVSVTITVLLKKVSILNT